MTVRLVKRSLLHKMSFRLETLKLVICLLAGDLISAQISGKESVVHRVYQVQNVQRATIGVSVLLFKVLGVRRLQLALETRLFNVMCKRVLEKGIKKVLFYQAKQENRIR